MNRSPSQSIFSTARFDVLRLGLMGLAAIWSLSGLWRQFIQFDVIALAATLVGGYPIYKETYTSLKQKHINMEVSMTIAIIASLIVGAFSAAVVISFFVILAEFIEGYALDKARDTVTRLENITPKKALVKRHGEEIAVDVQTLEKNDIVIVRDGERIPVDGIITRGTAVVNQSSITGESMPTDKTESDRVYAGSINESGVIEVRTEKIGTETVFGKIIKLVEEAESKKSPIQKISDKLATRLVVFAVVSSIVTLLITRNPISSISVIIVAGSCGVAAGTPLAIVATIGRAAKKGVIVKGGIYLEEMTRVDTVIIDKTGTLTLGEPTVTKVRAFNGSTESEVLSYAASVEGHSNHPVSRAIMRKAAELNIRPLQHSQFTYSPGRGVISEYGGERILVGNIRLMIENNIPIPVESQDSPQGTTTILVAHNNTICGTISLVDDVRDISRNAIARLKKMGLNTIMLTGDNETAAKLIGEKVGVNEFYADLLPQDKVLKIEQLVTQGHRVVMVGDGVNDAPALARANVGIGMGAGTDVAVEEADIVLMTNDLEKIPDLLNLSKSAYWTIMGNFYGTISIDAIGVALAFLGFLNPLVAALIHTGSELAFIANSARLMR